VNITSASLPALRLVKAGWLLGILLLWASLLFFPLFYFTVYPGREQYLAIGKEIGWKTGFFQGTRGQIVDREGTPLAWTERQFDLQLTRKLNRERTKAIQDALNIIFLDKIPPLPVEPSLIRSNLVPAELHRYAAISEQFPELELNSRQIRVLAKPELQQIVGQVENKNNIITGTSGWEQQFDRNLRGKVGFFTVMTDRRGQWVQESWKLLRMPLSGKDVRVDGTMEEILEKIKTKPPQP